MRRRTHALTESLSRGARGVLRALLLGALGLALLPGCGSADPTTTTIVVKVQSVPTAAVKLVVTATLDSKPAMQNLEVVGDLSHFGVRLPAATTGSLALVVSAYSSVPCRLATGKTTVAVGPPYRFETTVTLAAVEPSECMPAVVSLPAAVCPAGTFCWNNPLPQGNAYLGVWATSATDAWAVGPVGTLAHYDGTRWITVSSGVTSTLRGVWAAAAGDVWVVGEGGTILHYKVRPSYYRRC